MRKIVFPVLLWMCGLTGYAATVTVTANTCSQGILCLATSISLSAATATVSVPLCTSFTASSDSSGNATLVCNNGTSPTPTPTPTPTSLCGTASNELLVNGAETILVNGVYALPVHGSSLALANYAGGSVAIPFTPTASGVSGSFSTAATNALPWVSTYAHLFMDLSVAECSFNYADLSYTGSSMSVCATGSLDGMIDYKVDPVGTAAPNTSTGSYCQLFPGLTYYLNIRNEDPYNAKGVDSCPPGSQCGFNLMTN